jgi:hypothetical protein
MCRITRADFVSRCSVTQCSMSSGPLTRLVAKEPPKPRGEPAGTVTGLLLSSESFHALGLLVMLDLALQICSVQPSRGHDLIRCGHLIASPLL